MIPGSIQGVEGRRCSWMRSVEKSVMREKFSELVEKLRAAKSDKVKEPSWSLFNRIFFKKFGATYSAKPEQGVIEKENKRTVWIRFGNSSLANVKKSKVEIL